MEEWRDVKGYEGLYQVSSEGRVKSLERVEMRKDGSRNPIRRRILKPAILKSGYLQVGFTKDKKSKSFTVHQLVAIAFLGHIPNGYETVVDHIDNNKLNNNVENLQIISSRENVSKDQYRYSRSSKYIGVCWDKGDSKWRVKISINGKNKSLGSFVDEIEASKEYQKVLNVINNESEEYIKKYIEDNYTTKYSSNHRGVCWNKQKKKWMTRIWIGGKQKHLGFFKSEIDAAQAYKNALALV